MSETNMHARQLLTDSWNLEIDEKFVAEIFEGLCNSPYVPNSDLVRIISERDGYIGDFASVPYLRLNQEAFAQMKAALLARLERLSSWEILEAAEEANHPLVMSILELLKDRADYDIIAVLKIVAARQHGNYFDWLNHNFGRQITAVSPTALVNLLDPPRPSRKWLAFFLPSSMDTVIKSLMHIISSAYDRWPVNEKRFLRPDGRMNMPTDGRLAIVYVLKHYKNGEFLYRCLRGCSRKTIFKVIKKAYPFIGADGIQEQACRTLAERSDQTAEELIERVSPHVLKRGVLSHFFARKDYPSSSLLQRFVEEDCKFVLDLYERTRMAESLLTRDDIVLSESLRDRCHELIRQRNSHRETFKI